MLYAHVSKYIVHYPIAILTLYVPTAYTSVTCVVSVIGFPVRQLLPRFSGHDPECHVNAMRNANVQWEIKGQSGKMNGVTTDYHTSRNCTTGMT